MNKRLDAKLSKLTDNTRNQAVAQIGHIFLERKAQNAYFSAFYGDAGMS